MSIFGSIVSAIFGHSHSSPPGTTAAAGSSAAPTSPAAAGSAGKPMTKAEVEAMIEKLADAQDEEYNWEESIVDLMKLLKLDSSLTARKQLAQELGYTGALNGSAEMNIWLHQQVMTKLAESGGKVPESLKK
jgi:Rieske Fe-S protein